MIIEAYGEISESTSKFHAAVTVSCGPQTNLLPAVNLVYFLLLTIQMAVNCICCCAPVYRTIFPNIPLLRSMKSKLSILYGSRSKDSQDSDESPMETIVTIGGNVIKRTAGNERGWTSLNDSGIGTRVESDSITQFVRCANSTPPTIDWADVSNTADVGPGLIEEQPPWHHTHRKQAEQGVYVQRSFEVV